MLGLFDSVKALLKLDSVCIDNNIFRLHYKATVVFLVTFSVLVTARQYIGDPIDCLVDGVPLSVMDTYCWIHATFTLPEWSGGKIGTEVAHPGVGPQTSEQPRYHKFYQWVCFVLVLQAGLFYTPRYLWKIWEGGRIKGLINGMNGQIIDEIASREHRNIIVSYFIRNLRAFNLYAQRFLICEALNFANVLGQIYFMDTFLDGEFSTYGPNVLLFSFADIEDRDDPMSRVFPKVTKCTFHKYGPSGSVVNIDGMCVLPLNIVNEKIFIFLWFWFVILSAVSGLSLVYRSCALCWPWFRIQIINLFNHEEHRRRLVFLSRQLSASDWFLLCQIEKNVDHMFYITLVEELSDSFQVNELI